MSPETLKAIFLSNYTFFHHYGSQLCGLTGTLGAEAEHASLSSLYGVEVFEVPRASGRKYVQKPAKVVGDRAAWADGLREEVEAQRRTGRATLIVCETIKDVKGLADNLRGSPPQLQTYTSAGQRLVFPDPDHLITFCSIFMVALLCPRGAVEAFQGVCHCQTKCQPIHMI